MLVHHRVSPSIKFAGTHLYTWVERGTVKTSTQQCPRPGLEPGPLHPESSLQAMRPSNGPELCNKTESWNMLNYLFYSCLAWYREKNCRKFLLDLATTICHKTKVREENTPGIKQTIGVVITERKKHGFILGDFWEVTENKIENIDISFIYLLYSTEH